MKIKIKRIDTSLSLPNYESEGACGFDFITREDTTISPKMLGLVPTNCIIEVPKGYVLLVVPRSSTPRKKGLLIPHGIGVIDNDYHGPEDEIWFQTYNFTDKEVIVKRGERIAQGLFVPVARGEFEEVSEIKEESRGGFGSTG